MRIYNGVIIDSYCTSLQKPNFARKLKFSSKIRLTQLIVLKPVLRTNQLQFEANLARGLLAMIGRTNKETEITTL